MTNGIAHHILKATKRIFDNNTKEAQEQKRQAQEEEAMAKSIREAENLKQLNLANEKKQQETLEKREAIDKEVNYLENLLTEINGEINMLDAPVVVDYIASIERNSIIYNHSFKETQEIKQEIIDKSLYSISTYALLGLKISIAMILASIVGKLSVVNPEMVEELISFTIFENFEFVNESLGLFLDFLLQEFILVFVISSALTWIIRDEAFIHNKTIKYITIWLIAICLIAIIFLGTL